MSDQPKSSEREQLLALLDRATDVEVLACFEGMPEAVRRSHKNELMRRYLALERAGVDSRPGKPGSVANQVRVLQNYRIAVFETATVHELRNAGFVLSQEHGDYELLARRGRERLTELMQLEIEESYRAVGQIRGFMAQGLCDAPKHENWLLGHMWWLRDHIDHRRETLAETLRSRPQWLATDLWQMLDLEGIGDCSLAGTDKYACGQQTWADALKELADEGTVDRARLLDVTLEALARDYLPFRAGWFSRFHEHLQPTPEERTQRSEQYLLLLGSSVPPTVTFAAKALLAVDQHAAIDAHRIAESMDPMLGHKAKATVEIALRLLTRARQRNPMLLDATAQAVCRALLHDAAAVQQAALRWLGNAYETPALASLAVRAAIATARDTVQPSLQPLLEPWLGAAGEAPNSALAETPGAFFGTPTEPVVAIATRDELLLELTAAVEAPHDAIAFERVLDGVARFGPTPPDLHALAKRAAKLIERYEDVEGHDPVQLNLCQLVVAWYSGAAIRATPYVRDQWYGPSHARLLLLVLAEIAQQLGTSQQRLSTPTDTRGFVAADELVRRAQNRSGDNLADQVLSLLRLAPGGRSNAVRRAATNVVGEYGQALQHALGGDGVAVGATQALWLAAARARHPNADDQLVAAHFPDAGPGGAIFGTASFATTGEGRFRAQDLLITPSPPANVPALHPTVLNLSESSKSHYKYNVAGDTESLIKWSAILAPSNLEAYFANGFVRLDVAWSGVQWAVRHFFEPMLFADCMLGEHAHRLLAIGLAAKEAGQWGMAVDAAITAIADQRLQTEMLGAAMAELLVSGIVLGGRWARSLSEVARVSTEHRKHVVAATCRALRGDPQCAPKDLKKLLEFLHENCIASNTSISDADARSFLGSIQGGSGAAKLCKALLAR